MLTDNLIKLFGGKKKNNTKKLPIILSIVVFVIIIILIYFFVIKKQLDTTKSNTGCSKYNDDEEYDENDISDDCINELWKEVGCTTDVIALKNKQKELDKENNKNSRINLSKQKMKFSEFKQTLKIISQIDKLQFKEKCYGTDKSKWPIPTVKPRTTDKCLKYNENDKYKMSDISDDCINELWKELGCTVDIAAEFNKHRKKDISGTDLLYTEPMYKFSDLKKIFKITSKIESSDIKEKCYGTDKLKWPILKSNPKTTDKCLSYKDTDLLNNISDDCIAETWRDIGCVTDFENTTINQQFIHSQKPKLTFGQFKQGLKLELMYDENINYPGKNKEIRQQCYGVDKAKWPVNSCDTYNNDSKNVSDDCIAKIYSTLGCPNFNINNITPEDKNELKNKSYEMLIRDAYLTQIYETDKSNTLCYGTDKLKWPAECSQFGDDSTGINNKCVEDLWNKAGCKENVSINYNYSTNLKTIKNNIKTISESNDLDIKAQCYGYPNVYSIILNNSKSIVISTTEISDVTIRINNKNKNNLEPVLLKTTGDIYGDKGDNNFNNISIFRKNYTPFKLIFNSSKPLTIDTDETDKTDDISLNITSSKPITIETKYISNIGNINNMNIITPSGVVIIPNLNASGSLINTSSSLINASGSLINSPNNLIPNSNAPNNLIYDSSGNLIPNLNPPNNLIYDSSGNVISNIFRSPPIT